MYKNRIGEEKLNDFGSKMQITNQYREDNVTYVAVYFPKYNWTNDKVRYSNFKKGFIKCPYERRVYNKGFVGEGKYNPQQDKLAYDKWRSMMLRCYDKSFHKKHPAYVDCEVEEYFHNFQNFVEWFYDNYYEVGNEVICLDKDILYEGNKIYSRKTCIFVPQRINNLFIKANGVYYDTANKKYRSSLGGHRFDTYEDAYNEYIENKHKIVKERILEYEGKIPENTYNKLLKYTR